MAAGKLKLAEFSFLTWLEPFVALGATKTNAPGSIYRSSLAAWKDGSRSDDELRSDVSGRESDEAGDDREAYVSVEDNHTVGVETSPCADGNTIPPLSYDYIVSTTHRANNFSHTISSRNTTSVTKTIPFADNFTPLSSVKITPFTRLMQDKDFERNTHPNPEERQSFLKQRATKVA